ncbi:MAG TPA: hypothetical protein VF042_13025 [Gemmatimonadaceae bacterium]
MTGIVMLWLPILVSAAIVFVASALIHMLSPWHKGDYVRLSNENEFRSAVGPLDLPPGDYMVPHPQSRENLRSPEFLAKANQGPNVIMTVLPKGMPGMGRNLALWFLYVLLVGVLCAYVAGRSTPPGAVYMHVFQLVSTVAFIAYAVALWQMSIWYRRSWNTTFKATVDGLIYGLLTAGAFGWLWPR